MFIITYGKWCLWNILQSQKEFDSRYGIRIKRNMPSYHGVIEIELIELADSIK